MPVVVATGDLHHTIPRLSVGRASVGWRHNMHKTGKALQNVGKGMYVSLACGLRRRSLHFDTLAYSGACVLMALITSHSLCFLRGRRASADLIPSWQELLIRPGVWLWRCLGAARPHQQRFACGVGLMKVGRRNWATQFSHEPSAGRSAGSKTKREEML